MASDQPDASSDAPKEETKTAEPSAPAATELTAAPPAEPSVVVEAAALAPTEPEPIIGASPADVLATDPLGASRAPTPAPPENPEGIAVHMVGTTDVGLIREHNEDNFVCVRLKDDERGPEVLLHHAIADQGTLLVVCDGMGGAAAGEVASSMAVSTLPEVMRSDSTAAAPTGTVDDEWAALARKLRYAAEEANRRIFVEQQQNIARAGMGTTMTAALLRGTKAIIAQVGDSRCYVQREGVLTQVTRDQSLVNQLLETGQITAEQAKYFEHSNVILQALGVQQDVEVQLSRVDLRRGDRMVLCSDGLVGVVSDEEIAAVLGSVNDPGEAARILIELANSGGGPDNITVVVAYFAGTDLPEPGPEDLLHYETWRIDPVPPAAVVTMEADEPPSPETPHKPHPALRAVEILSMAVIAGLIAGSVAVGATLYDKAQTCQVHAARAGLTILVDDHDSGVRTSEGNVALRLPPGRHRVAVTSDANNEAANDVAKAGERELSVVMGESCATSFDDAAAVEGAAEIPR